MLQVGAPRVHEEVGRRLGPEDWRPTLVAALLAVAATALLIVAVASVTPFERPAVVASMNDGVRALASALIGACATIAALTLTTLGLLDVFETRGFGPRFLLHMRLTVVGSLATIFLSVGAILFTLFPSAGGSDIQPVRWQVDVAFYALIALSALSVGGLAVVLTSLYSMIGEVFRSLPADWVRDILSEEPVDDLLDDRDREDPTAVDRSAPRQPVR